MELEGYGNAITRQKNFLPMLNMQGLRQYLPEINEDSLMTVIYIALFSLTCYALLFMSYSMSANRKRKNKYDTTGEIYFEQKLIKESEDMKCYAWKNWMNRLEPDWEKFDNAINKIKQKWLEQREHYWEAWIKEIEQKWDNYHEYIDISYKLYILKRSLSWNESHWEHWANEELKVFLDKEWHEWVNQTEHHLNTWIMNEWTKWNSSKISSWLSKNWKLSENAYWEKMTKKKWVKSLFKLVQKNWRRWNKRITREQQEWDDWVKEKQDLYMNNHEWDAWNKWKANKYNSLEEVKESLVRKWISEKRWVAWIADRHHSLMQDKYEKSI